MRREGFVILVVAQGLFIAFCMMTGARICFPV